MWMKFIGSLTYTEKYESNWEEKKKYINTWWLFQRDDGTYSVKFLGSWLNVYPPKPRNTNESVEIRREAVDGINISDVPF